MTSFSRSILALIDARRVEIFESGESGLQRIDEVRAHHVNEQPAHLGTSAQPGFHVGTRGGTGRDRLQRALREGTTRMEREAVESILRHAGSDAAILVAGTPQHRRELHKRLAPAAGDRVLELKHLDIHATPAELAAAVAAGRDELRNERITREVAAIIEMAGARGPASVGLETTRWALGQGRVKTLFLTSRFVHDHAGDAESLIEAARGQDADVEIASDGVSEELDEHEGVGARLRYRLV